MQASEKAHLREGVFRVSITLKGLHALLELVAGAALFAISPDFILRVIALLKSKRWAYPAAMIVFGAFILYQVYRFTLTRSPGLIALS
jgi:uncharacterized membrane protein